MLKAKIRIVVNQLAGKFPLLASSRNMRNGKNTQIVKTTAKICPKMNRKRMKSRVLICFSILNCILRFASPESLLQNFALGGRVRFLTRLVTDLFIYQNLSTLFAENTNAFCAHSLVENTNKNPMSLFFKS